MYPVVTLQWSISTVNNSKFPYRGWPSFLLDNLWKLYFWFVGELDWIIPLVWRWIGLDVSSSVFRMIHAPPVFFCWPFPPWEISRDIAFLASLEASTWCITSDILNGYPFWRARFFHLLNSHSKSWIRRIFR